MSNRDASGAAAGQPSAKKRLLLIEDDSRTRLLLLNYLNNSGLEVVVAANATLALRKLAEVQVDGVMFDLAVRGMNSLDLVKELRGKKSTAETPIFVCTNDARVEACRKIEKAGATAVYDKTVTRMEKIVADIVGHLVPKPPPAEPKAPTKPAPKPVTLDEIPSLFQPVGTEDVMQFSIGSNLPSPAPPPSTNPKLETAFDWAVVPQQAPEIPEASPEMTDVVPADFFSALPQETISASTAELASPDDPQALAALNRELQARLDAVTSERDALVGLMGDPSGARPAASGEPEALEEAKAAATRAEAAYQVEAARSRQFEEQLHHLQRVRDELNEKLAREEAERAESKRRSEELELRLSESLGEIDRLKAALDQHVAEKGSLEANLRDELEAAKATAQKAELACHEERSRSLRSTEEIDGLRRARDELTARLAGEHEAAEESRRRSEEREQQLRQSAGELERLANELERQVAERGSVASALSEQLKAAKASAENAEAACKEEAERGFLFQREATRLATAREELNRKLAEHEIVALESRTRSEELERRLAESNSELQRAKAELERRAAERSSVESQLRDQLSAAKEAAEKVKYEYREETSFFTKSTDDLAALRRVRDELNARLAAERELAATSRSRSAELEERLRDTKRELERARDELEKQRSLRSSLEERLDAAKEAAEAAKADLKQETALRAQLEKELAKLRKTRPEPAAAKGKSRGKAPSPAARKRIEKLVEDMLEQARVLQASLGSGTAGTEPGLDEAA